jgi:3-methyladenine DNA glycosylase AlkC
MAEPFKNLLNPDVVRGMGLHLHRAWEKFPRSRFERAACAGLEDLEMKARAEHIARAPADALPGDFTAAASVLEASLAPVGPDTGEGDEGWSLRLTSTEGIDGWAIWPMTHFVAERGLAAPERSLRALHAMTQRLTAEWAIRPFLLTHPDLTFARLREWVEDPSAHVRRLVSEGSRPRLPWGVQLKPLIADPSPTLPLLAALQDDPSAYVRRSVANHLNDIAKDHPAIVADWLDEHLPGASRDRRALLRHASRTLIKRGDRRVLRAWGLGQALKGSASLRVSPARARIGGAIELVVTVRSTSARSQSLVIDYAVHNVLGSGGTSVKVWKGWTVQLPPREERRLVRRHSLRPVTTRRQHPGRHAVDVRINGRVEARGAFTLSK